MFLKLSFFYKLFSEKSNLIIEEKYKKVNDFNNIKQKSTKKKSNIKNILLSVVGASIVIPSLYFAFIFIKKKIYEPCRMTVIVNNIKSNDFKNLSTKDKEKIHEITLFYCDYWKKNVQLNSFYNELNEVVDKLVDHQVVTNLWDNSQLKKQLEQQKKTVEANKKKQEEEEKQKQKQEKKDPKQDQEKPKDLDGEKLKQLEQQKIKSIIMIKSLIKACIIENPQIVNKELKIDYKLNHMDLNLIDKIAQGNLKLEAFYSDQSKKSEKEKFCQIVEKLRSQSQTEEPNKNANPFAGLLG